MTILAVVVLCLLLPLVAHDAIRRPVIRRIAVRNLLRRRGEATLVVVGSLLATALITASFVIGDSFGASIGAIADDRWGDVDQVVAADSPSGQAEVARLLIGADAIDQVLVVDETTVSIGTTTGERRIEAAARAAVIDDAAGGVTLVDSVAEDLGVVAGDDVEVFVGNASIEVLVEHVVADRAMPGPADIAVPSSLITAVGEPRSAGIDHAVYVSLADGADESAVASLLQVASVDVDVQPVKADLLELAETEAEEMTALFGTIGAFSVVAGVLLVVNLFVMLADERRGELGTMRAVGISRGAVVRSFALEGAIHGAGAAAAGTVVGMGIGAGVVRFAAGALGADELRTSFELMSLASGAAIGFAVSQLTVTLTSLRTSRLNIVRALSDLPNAARRRRPRLAALAGLAGVTVAALGLAAGSSSPFVLMAAPSLGLITAVPLLVPVIGRTPAVVATHLAGLLWTLAVFGLAPDVMADPEASIFLLQGLLMVGISVRLLATLDGAWARLARIGGIGARLGLAQPLARPGRSSLLVAMYSLVIFTVTFIAILASVFGASSAALATQTAGGYDVIVESNPAAGLTVGELMARDGIANVTPMRDAPIVVGSGDSDAWTVTALAADFGAGTQRPELEARDASFGSDDAAWHAVLGDSTDAAGRPWVIVPEESELLVGETASIAPLLGGDHLEVVVAGQSRHNWMIGTGFYVGAVTGDAVGAPAAPSRFLVAAGPGVDPASLASDLDAWAPERGLQAESILGLAEEETSGTQTFMSMLQAYLGAGLVIGIAGLGVVLVRAVRERRRELAVLRAIGVHADTVRRTFVVEAMFIGGQGVGLGVGLGLLSAWQTLSRTAAFEEGLTFAVPAVGLVGLAVGCLAASLGAAALPASRAGRISAASALRS